MKMSFLALPLASISMLTLPTVSHAAVVINIAQVGSDVVATVDGTLDLSSLKFDFLTCCNGPGAIWPINGAIVVGLDPFSGIRGYFGFVGLSSFGSGGYHAASISTGDVFGFNATLFGAPLIAVNDKYVSDTPLSGQSIFNNQTLASLGLNSGQYSYTAPSESVTVNIGRGRMGEVPEPVSWSLMILGFGFIGAAMRQAGRNDVLRDVRRCLIIPT